MRRRLFTHLQSAAAAATRRRRQAVVEVAGLWNASRASSTVDGYPLIGWLEATTTTICPRWDWRSSAGDVAGWTSPYVRDSRVQTASILPNSFSPSVVLCCNSSVKDLQIYEANNTFNYTVYDAAQVYALPPPRLRYGLAFKAALKFCFKTCVAMKFVDDDDDDDDDDES